MLDVTFYRDATLRIAGFSARGHADFAPQGSDIVCAAVSAVLQAAHLGLAHHAGAAVAVTQRSGRLEVTVESSARASEGPAAILATAELAAEAIAAQYPTHVRVKRAALPLGMRNVRAQRIGAPRARRRDNDV